MLEMFDEVIVKIPERKFVKRMFFLFKSEKYKNFCLLINLSKSGLDKYNYAYDIFFVHEKYISKQIISKQFLIIEKKKDSIQLIKDKESVFIQKSTLPMFIDFIKTTENFYYNYHKIKGPTIFNKINYWLKTKLKIY